MCFCPRNNRQLIIIISSSFNRDFIINNFAQNNWLFLVENELIFRHTDTIVAILPVVFQFHPPDILSFMDYVHVAPESTNLCVLQGTKVTRWDPLRIIEFSVHIKVLESVQTEDLEVVILTPGAGTENQLTPEKKELIQGLNRILAGSEDCTGVLVG